MKRFFAGIISICLVTGFSCNKDANNAGSTPGTALKTERGKVTGQAVKKQIGASGGTLSSPDNYISLMVPAGAVDGATEFSIQEVQTGDSIPANRLFRILPEDITLKKPVELSFRYTAEDLRGIDDDFLYPFYQSSDGYWHKAKGSTLDKATKTLRVSTTHFSDWGIVRTLEIYASKDELESGETINLEGLYLDEYSEKEGGLAFLYRLTPAQVVGWKILAGGGTISGGKASQVTYMAATVSAAQDVTIELKAKNFLGKQPDRPGAGGMAICLQQLQVFPGEYISWEIDGKQFKAHTIDISICCGRTSIFGKTSDGKNNIAIDINSTSKGSFKMGNSMEEGKSSVTVQHEELSYRSIFQSCESNDESYGPGSVNLSEVGEPGKLVTGSFDCTLYQSGKCNKVAKKVTGSFRIKRNA